MLTHLPIPVGLLLVAALSYFCAEYYKPIIESDVKLRTQIALENLPGSKIEVQVNGQIVSLDGEVPNEDVKRKAVEEAAQVPGVVEVRNLLRVPKGLSPDACEAVITALFERESLPFAGYGVELNPSSSPVLDRLASIMGECPAAHFTVYGFADTRLPAEKYKQQAMLRAQAVVGHLTARGVAANRLTPLPVEAGVSKGKIEIWVKK